MRWDSEISLSAKISVKKRRKEVSTIIQINWALSTRQKIHNIKTKKFWKLWNEEWNVSNNSESSGQVSPIVVENTLEFYKITEVFKMEDSFNYLKDPSNYLFLSPESKKNRFNQNTKID